MNQSRRSEKTQTNKLRAWQCPQLRLLGALLHETINSEFAEPARNTTCAAVNMKNIHEVVRKELELQQMSNGAIREKELGLRQLKGILLHALNLVNGLLDETPAQTIPPFSENESSEPERVLEQEAETEGSSQVDIRKREKKDLGSENPHKDLP